MKVFAAVVALLPVFSSAHTIVQRVRVNGKDQGQEVGVRVATSNNPILSVNDQNFACRFGFKQPVSTKVIDVKAGDKVGMWWGHVVGGAQYANDPDHPIAPSHKGPVIYYMAKASNAATASPNTLRWFKVHEDGVDGSGVWGVDRMIKNGGWIDFTLPTCLAPGNYLLRSEIIALHEANVEGKAQFYMGCAQINVSSSGKSAGGSTVSFPGGYSSRDGGILYNVYNSQGQPKGSTPYKVPGPSVFKC